MRLRQRPTGGGGWGGNQRWVFGGRWQRRRGRGGEQLTPLGKIRPFGGRGWEGAGRSRVQFFNFEDKLYK